MLHEALQIGVLCNNASISGANSDDYEDFSGEPLEIALLVAGDKANIRRNKLLKRMPEARKVAFDPEVKMMATYHKKESSFYVAAKGAPEEILKSSSVVIGPEGAKKMTDEVRQEWLESCNTLAEEGLRIIAVAKKEVKTVEEEPYQDLEFIGLIGFFDPPRKEIAPAIAECKKAVLRIRYLRLVFSRSRDNRDVESPGVASLCALWPSPPIGPTCTIYLSEKYLARF